MNVKLTINEILKKEEKEYLLKNYEEKFFPPRPKGELSFDKLFEYLNKLLKEQYSAKLPFIDLTDAICKGIIYEVKVEI